MFGGAGTDDRRQAVKVVVAYCDLHPATKIAAEEADHVRWGDTSADAEAYWRLLREMWAEGDTFAVLEQDKVPGPGALRAIHDCERAWCAYPVEQQGGGLADFPTLSCAKFGASLMARWPGAVDIAGQLSMGYFDGAPITGRHYRRLDMAMARVLWTRSGPVHWHPAGMVEHRHQ